MAAKDLQSILGGNYLECALCLEQYKQPKVLQCMHTFCLECLTIHIEKNGVGDQKRKFHCPYCRKLIVVPEGGVDKFTTNHMFNSMLDLLNSEKKIERHCTSCVTENGNEKPVATHRCLPCGDDLCKDCYKMHRQMKLTMGHKVLPIDEIQSGKHTEELRTFTTVKCTSHPDEIVKFFCDSCKTLICRDCAIVEHAGHTVNHLSKARESLEPVLKKGISNISVNKDKMTNMTQSIEHQISELENCHKTAQTILAKTYDDVIAQLKKDKTRLSESLKGKSRAKIKILKIVLDNAMMQATTYISQHEFVTKLLSQGTDAEVLAQYKDLKALIGDEQNQAMKSMQEKIPKQINLSFVPKKNQLILGLGDIEEKEILPADIDSEYRRAVIITGMKASTSDDTLWMYLENRKRSGGGETERIQRISGDEAVVVFQDEADAERVLKQQKHQLDGSYLHVGRGSKLVSFIEQKSQNDKEHLRTVTVHITGLNPSTSNETLQMYFESRKRTGGGNIKSIQRASSSDAVIVFEDKEDVDGVLKRQIFQIDGFTCYANQRDVFMPVRDEDDEKHRTLIITGLNLITDDETLQMFFESKKRSGGGPLQKIIRQDRKRAVLVFENKEDAMRVLQKSMNQNGIVLDGCQLSTSKAK